MNHFFPSDDFVSVFLQTFVGLQSKNKVLHRFIHNYTTLSDQSILNTLLRIPILHYIYPRTNYSKVFNQTTKNTIKLQFI